MVSGNLLKAAVAKSLRLALPYARSYALATMTESILVVRLHEPVFNPVTGRLASDTSDQVYAGPASVSTVSGPQVLNLGESPVYFSAAEAQIPAVLDAPNRLPQINDLVTIVAAADSNMVSRKFRVTDVGGGGALPAMTRLELVGIEPSDEVEHG